MMNEKEKDVDLLVLLNKLLINKRIVLRFMLISFIVGFFVALTSPVEYTARTIVIPQIKESGGMRGLGGLAAMAGINVGEESDNQIKPALYPKVTKSILFLRTLLDVPLKFESIDKEITYKEYYLYYKKRTIPEFIKRYTIGLPSLIINSIISDKINQVKVNRLEDIYVITKQEKQLLNQIQKQLIVKSEKEGFVSLSFSMPEALPAAKMVLKSQKLLEDFITEFKINKAKGELVFIEKRYKEAKKDFIEKQQALANYRDRNINLNTSRAKTYLERLKSNYDLSFTVFSELAKKIETQKIKVKESTPVFTIIEPVTVPLNKSKPKRPLIVLIWLFFGLFTGIGVVFGKELLSKIKIK